MSDIEHNIASDTNEASSTDIVPVDTSVEAAMLDYCPKCGRSNVPVAHSPNNAHICLDCERAVNSRYTHARNHQPDWPDIARQNGLELWERQPGETMLEFSIWQAYRDAYPGKKPSYKDAARQLNTSYEVVKKVASRWSFNLRLQAWMTYCDELTLQQRHTEILAMNSEHIAMAARLRAKLSAAIDQINPAELKASDINSLFKTATELERKARVDTMAQEEMRNMLCKDNSNPELQKTQTKTDDLGEVVKILMKAGVLGDVTQAGIRKTTTTTTEIVVKDDNDNSTSLVTEE